MKFIEKKKELTNPQMYHVREMTFLDINGNTNSVIVGLLSNYTIVVKVKKDSGIFSECANYYCGTDPDFISMVYTSIINTITKNKDFFKVYDPVKVVKMLIPIFDVNPVYKSNRFTEFLLEGLSTGGIIKFSKEQLKHIPS